MNDNPTLNPNGTADNPTIESNIPLPRGSLGARTTSAAAILRSMTETQSVSVAAADVGCYAEAARYYGIRISRRRQEDGTYRIWVVAKLNPLAKIDSTGLRAELRRRGD